MFDSGFGAGGIDSSMASRRSNGVERSDLAFDGGGKRFPSSSSSSQLFTLSPSSPPNSRITPLRLVIISQVAFGRIREETPEEQLDASVYFYDLPQATKRRNGVIFEGTGEGQKLKIVDMVGLLGQDEEEGGVGKKWIYPGEF